MWSKSISVNKWLKLVGFIFSLLFAYFCGYLVYCFIMHSGVFGESPYKVIAYGFSIFVGMMFVAASDGLDDDNQ